MIGTSVALALAVGMLPAAPAVHPNSFSRSLVAVEEDGVHLFLALQTLSVFEVLPGADPDGNLFLQPAELSAVRDELVAYVQEHYVLRPREGAAKLAGRLVTAEIVNDDSDALNFQQFIELELFYATSGALAALEVEMTLFFDTSPRHQDRAVVSWPDGTRQSAVLWQGESVQTFRPDRAPERSVLADLRIGAEHILTGYDHLAYVLALLVASTRLRSLVGVVTAFTLAHSVTLTLAALDVVSVPTRSVEIAIALSIAYVGVANLVRPGPRPLWIEAFVFGLVHGLGFASALADVLAVQADRLRALVLFNLGIELGQLAVVMLALLLLWPLHRQALARWRASSDTAGSPAPTRLPGLAPPAVRVLVSVGAFVLGLGWALERALA